MGIIASGLATSADSSFDPRALDSVKLAAKSGDAASTRKVAQQFEAMFLSMMLKNMRAALPNSDPLASDASRMATDLYDQQLAQNIAGHGKGVGLADALVAQITRGQGQRAANGADASGSETPRPVVVAPSGTPEAQKAGAAPVHRDFVDRFKDAAIAAAEATGLPAKVILGQAALESGWGRHEVRDHKGAGSFNLFGIKAGGNWTGATVQAVTTEVIDGVAQKVVQTFRAYASYAESFTDYAKMVANNPRYGKAVAAAGDALQFAKEMGKSGYATDPDYGSKLARIFAGPLGRLL